MSFPVSHLAAICLAVAGFTCWVLCDSVIKFAGQSHLPNAEIIGFLGLFMSGFIVLYAVLKQEANSLWPMNPRRLLVRSALDLGNNFFVVVALRHLSLALFYILIFTSPLLVTILGRLFLNERLDWQRAAAIVLGFAGVIVAVHPTRSGGHGDWRGLAACAICVTCFSIGIAWSRVLTKTERAESVTLFSGLVTGVAGIAGTAVRAAPVSTRLLATLMVMGMLGAVGNICVYTALKHTTAATVSQYHYTQLISGAIAGYLLFHERPTTWMATGALLIVGSGLYMAMRTPPGSAVET